MNQGSGEVEKFGHTRRNGEKNGAVLDTQDKMERKMAKEEKSLSTIPQPFLNQKHSRFVSKSYVYVTTYTPICQQTVSYKEYFDVPTTLTIRSANVPNPLHGILDQGLRESC